MDFLKGVSKIAHKVKCYYCGETFDRDKTPCLKVTGNRYAHLDCIAAEKVKVQQQAHPEEKILTKEEQDLIDLEKYILELLNLDRLNVKIRKQIKDYHTQYKYTYSGMLKTLKYFYEIRGNSKEKANGGIGIVPYVYDEANRYYYAIWVAQQKNIVKPIEMTAPETRVIIIPVPKRQEKKKWLRCFEDLEELLDGV